MNQLRPQGPRRRLTIVNQYYGPAESTGQLLQELCEDLAAEIDVTIIAARPPDPAHRPAPVPGLTIRWARATAFEKASLALRLLNYLTFLALAVPQAFRGPKPGAILCMTNPPFIGLVGILASRLRGARLLITIQDVHPQVGLISGRLTSPPAVWALRAVQRLFFSQADRIVAISAGMRDALIEHGARPERVAVVPNWVDVGEITPHPRDNSLAREYGLEHGFVVIHAGNVGLLQALETFVEAAAKSGDAKLVIVGGGALHERLVAQAERQGSENVVFVPRQPRERLNLVLASGDAHLVSLMPGLAGLMEPSKLYGVLAAGRPVLAAMEDRSEAAQLVREVGCGIVVAPGDADALAAAIRELAGLPRAELERMGAAGRAHAERFCVRERAVEGYRALLSELGA